MCVIENWEFIFEMKKKIMINDWFRRRGRWMRIPKGTHFCNDSLYNRHVKTAYGFLMHTHTQKIKVSSTRSAKCIGSFSLSSPTQCNQLLTVIISYPKIPSWILRAILKKKIKWAIVRVRCYYLLRFRRTERQRPSETEINEGALTVGERESKFIERCISDSYACSSYTTLCNIHTAAHKFLPGTIT